ncbi:MAG: DUF1569 domain-containing protein [Saprospiraceae bacterium]|nr:DUF1569 domain-containing protein [Saprospiraceae bacterium]
MKSIFDPDVRTEVIERIDRLTPASTALWGEMSVTQMVRHCVLCEDYYFGRIKMKRSLVGRMVGRMAIRAILKDEQSTLKKNAPTAPEFKIKANITHLDAEKLKWKTYIDRYSTFNQSTFTHWFFGRLTKQELGQFIYKHSDHHLRQFGV